MSVYKRPGSDAFSYDIKVGGHRLSGTTGATERREAIRVQERIRAEAKRELKERAATPASPMSFGEAASRYWTEVGEHLKGGGDDNCLWSLDWLREKIGTDRRLVDIDDALVARLVAERRGERRTSNRKLKPKRRGEARGPVKSPPLVAPATVNRSVTEPLRKILNRAARTWKVPVPDVAWRDHMLREPRERVRELRVDEETRLFEALREDYHPVLRFALITGARIGEVWQVRWADVDFGGRQVWLNGKGSKRAAIPMPPALRELLWSLQGDHEDAVFTYKAARRGRGRKRGERYPLTRSGLQSAFRRALPNANVFDYRFHDNRHTAATRIRRAGADLKIVQQLLRHESITTTAKYAHVTADDVMEAMERAAGIAAPVAASHTENPTASVPLDLKVLEKKA